MRLMTGIPTRGGLGIRVAGQVEAEAEVVDRGMLPSVSSKDRLLPRTLDIVRFDLDSTETCATRGYHPSPHIIWIPLSNATLDKLRE